MRVRSFLAALTFIIVPGIAGCGAMQSLVAPAPTTQSPPQQGVSVNSPPADGTGASSSTGAPSSLSSPSAPVTVTQSGASGSPSFSTQSALKTIASFVADITAANPPKNPQESTPLVAVARPIAQIAASTGGPAGTSILDLIGAVATAIAGTGAVGASVVRKKNKTIQSHENTINELSAAVADKTKLSPVAQTNIAKVAANRT